MNTIMFVDDESWALHGLEDLLPWEEYGFTVASRCTDPREALEEIRRIRPDAVFTDIRMPGMSGIELIAAVKSENIAVEFIIISAYSDFVAAQKAITFGVCQYILKPFNRDEVKEAVLHLNERLRQKAENVIDLSDMTRGITPQMLQKLNKAADNPFCYVAIMDSAFFEPEQADGIRFLPVKINSHGTACLISVVKTKTGFIRTMRGKLAPGGSIGFSRPYSDYSQIGLMIAEAEYTLEGNFEFSSNPVVADIQLYICWNQTAALSLHNISVKSFLSETYLCEIFKKYTGITLLTFIKNIRLNRASRMMRYTDVELKEIAERVGYLDYCYFGRLFKREFGVSPEYYRNAIEGGNESF